MNQSRGFRSRRVLALIAMLFGAMVTTLLRPAYGQQDVNPTWYDPWAAPNAVVAHPSQPQVVSHAHQRKVKSVSSSQLAAEGSRDASHDTNKAVMTSLTQEAAQRNH